MKIAIFTDNFYPELSGISDSIITTAKELAKLGHTIKFFVPEYSKKNFQTAGLKYKKEIDLGDNITITRLFAFPFIGPTKQARMVIPIGIRTLAIRKFNPDIIHSHLFFGVGIEALIASKILGIPFIGTNHTAITEFLKYAPFKNNWLKKISIKYVNWYYGKCQFVSAPSQSVFDEMKRNGFNIKHEIISNPIELDIFNKPKKINNIDEKKIYKKTFRLNDKTIVCVGRLAPEKNIDIIIKAIAIVKKIIPDITLIIAGHGTSSQLLENLVEKLKLTDNVRFLGTLNHKDLSNLYKASEIFTIASTSETQSMALIQAMACKLPVIGVRARALPEYIGDRGILIKPGDIKMLAQKIVFLLGDSKLRDELGEQGFQFVQNFSQKNIALKWGKIYQKNINNLGKMKLSIIIPAHNEQEYIAQCLKSIKKDAKTVSEDIEIIVVNNACTDNTKEIALSFPGVSVVDENRRGLSMARQAGFRASTGDLIANVDADTIMPSGWTKKVLREFTKNDNLVALSGPYVYYDRSFLMNVFIWLSYYSIGYLSHLINHHILKIGALLQGGNFILKKSALEKISGFNTDIKFYGEDIDIARRIQKQGRVKFTFLLPMKTSARRFTQDGTIKTAIKYIINYFWVIFFKKPFRYKYTYVGESNQFSKYKKDD